MRKIFTLFFLFAIFFQAVAVHAEEYNFRKTRWGMSQEQIMDSEESDNYLRNQKSLLYTVQVLEKAMLAEYYFVENKLVRAGYTLAESHIVDTKYVGDYGEIKEVLNRKYGDPKEDRVVWKNDYFKSNPQQWGTAVSVGHLSFFSVWETDSTIIAASLTGGDFKFSCKVVYQSKELMHLEKKIGNKGTDNELPGKKNDERNKKMRKAMENF